MALVWASLVVVSFALVIERLDLPGRAREVGRRSEACLDALRDPSLGDEAKEEELRRQAVRLFGLFGRLAGGSLLALGLPLGAVWGLDALGLASFSAVLSVLERVDFLMGATLVGVVTYLLIRRTGGS